MTERQFPIKSGPGPGAPWILVTAASFPEAVERVRELLADPEKAAAIERMHRDRRLTSEDS